MKKFINLNLILFFLFLVGCDSNIGTTVEDNGYFFDVVYQTVATRENKNLPWTNVNGTMQMKITQDTETAGTFIFYYLNYQEPQFVYNYCSGGFKGNFEVPTDSTVTDDESNYNVMTPYTGSTNSSSSSSGTDSTSTVSKIESYYFQLSITYKSLDAACRQESDRIIAIYRFSNGEIIVKNEYRELLMRPVLKSDEKIQ